MSTHSAERVERSEKLRDQVMDLVQEAGWTRDRLLPFATQPVQTAAGERAVSIRCDRFGDDGAPVQVALRAEYWSEGRNALSTCLKLVHEGMDLPTIRALVEEHLDDVLHAVEATYARRLFLAQDHEAQGRVSAPRM